MVREHGVLALLSFASLGIVGWLFRRRDPTLLGGDVQAIGWPQPTLAWSVTPAAVE